jgi:hypothetical protein
MLTNEVIATVATAESPRRIRWRPRTKPRSDAARDPVPELLFELMGVLIKCLSRRDAYADETPEGPTRDAARE